MLSLQPAGLAGLEGASAAEPGKACCFCGSFSETPACTLHCHVTPATSFLSSHAGWVYSHRSQRPFEGTRSHPMCEFPFSHAGWVYSAMATTGVSLLERQRRYQEAIDRLHQLLGELGWV